ncbi:MAG: FadR/GntR family transcriptional regulator [Burkholderiaceae bacterium]
MTTLRPTATRLTDTIVDELETRILEGSLKPGDRLTPERDLAVELGVSRPSLRAAIQTLVAKGLLVTRHGEGTVVTDKLDAPFVDPWQQMLKGHATLHGDLLEFRDMLESQAAQLAAERATDADIERIGAAFDALTQAYHGHNLDLCSETDVAFHQAIAEASHNVLIGHLSASLHRVIYGHVANNLVYLHGRPTQWTQLMRQHQAIWEAVRNRDTKLASKAAHTHIEFVRQTMAQSGEEVARQQRAQRRLGNTAR